MFDRTSRYANLAPYAVTDRRGRVVQVVPALVAAPQALLGYHLRKQGQRLDHLAQRWLGDASQSWRLAELAGAMHPDAIAEADEIAIPTRGTGS